MSFQKGYTPWNKGMHYDPPNRVNLYTPELNKRRSEKLMGRPSVNKGKKLSLETRIKMSFAKTGEKSPVWKGEKVSYSGLHKWVVSKLGNPKECWHCKTTKRAMYHWANISGRYKRNLEDWIRLCVPCHSRMDRGRT